ncbi:unnamed protein product [Paramecium sonneborni]|uniref:Uncharacterized protein n=1 Tax=Paramecium sonneborni TaxID=65129 RepID=A0A8S1QEL4_9CILI|nr:unnamed protein product [Paramecium sonneborni]
MQGIQSEIDKRKFSRIVLDEKKFIRIQLDQKHPQSNIYLTTKDFLKCKDQSRKKQKLDQLALMDIVAIINLEDQEVLYQEIPQLNPTIVQECLKQPYLENQGAVKLIDDVIKVQQKSVAIFCDGTYNKSHLLLICFLIYDRFKLLTDIKKIDCLQNQLCEINFENREIALKENNMQVKKEFYGYSSNLNYSFQTTLLQIQEAEKFQQTQISSVKTFTNEKKYLQYFFKIDNLNSKVPFNQQQISIIDLKSKYYENLQDIKAAQQNDVCSFIVLKRP